MNRSWTIALAALLAGAAAAIPSSAATSPATFADPTGDASDGAPDLAAVALASSADGGVAVRVTLATMPDLAPNGEVWVYLDTDLDPATGDRGAELLFIADAEFVYPMRWNGSTLEPFSVSLSPMLTGDGLEFRLPASLGLRRFALEVLSSTTESQTFGDVLGNGKLVYPPLPRVARVLVPPTALTVKAGRVLDLRGVQVETDSSEVVRPDAVTCTLRYRGVALAPLAGGCRWRIPKALRGKSLLLTVAVSLGDSRASQRLTIRPR